MAVRPAIAWHLDGTGKPQYAAEGNILTSGAALDWLAGLFGSAGHFGSAGLFGSAGPMPGGARLTDLALQVPDSGGVAFVPAFTGLGAPYWDRHATGTITGINGGTTPAHLARAALDAVANQVADVVDSVLSSDDAAQSAHLVADGGATGSTLLMQTQADLIGLPVVVTGAPEASALGAADLATQMLNGGKSEVSSAATARSVRYEPRITSAERDKRRAEWRLAVTKARTN